MTITADDHRYMADALRLAARGLRYDDGNMQKWVDRTLGKDSFFLTLVKGWRVLLMVGVIVAVFAAYTVYQKEAGTCSMRQQIPVREPEQKPRK